MKQTIIIRDQELIKKIDKLKLFWWYKTRTKFIEQAINESYDWYLQILEYRKSLKSPFWLSISDMINAREKNNLLDLERIKMWLK